MKHKFLIFTALSLPLLFMSCSKDNSDTPISEGKYKGTFSVTYKSGKQSGRTTLVLENGRYSCTGNPDRIPAGGSGTYSFEEGKITFTDENPWTTDFDGNLILEGQYDYQYNGKNLKISADKNGVGHYEYNLVKQ
jgi:major membrane immunogen (membrane-anchored lipoprotein)